MDSADPRIAKQVAGFVRGGANSNAAIINALVAGKTGYNGDIKTEEVLEKYLPVNELCAFLGIGSLNEFNPNLHARQALKFFILNLAEDLDGILREGQVSVEVTQFGPLREEHLPFLFDHKQRAAMGEEFFRQFGKPTAEEMAADALLMDGGLNKTAVKVALGWDGYRLINDLYQLYLCPNATLSFPTLTQSPYLPTALQTYYAKELEAASQLGSVMLSPFIRRTGQRHGDDIANLFFNESLGVSRYYGAINIAASIGSLEMAEKALTLGAHIVATPPTVINYKGLKGIEGFIAWLAEAVPDVSAASSKIALNRRDEKMVRGYEDFNPLTWEHIFRSPLSAEGYESFEKAEIEAAWALSKFISEKLRG